MANRTPGPPWLKVGRSVRYPAHGLDCWIENQIEQQTGQRPAEQRRQHSKALLNEREAAEYIGMSVAFLRRDRLDGRVKVE